MQNQNMEKIIYSLELSQNLSESDIGLVYGGTPVQLSTSDKAKIFLAKTIQFFKNHPIIIELACLAVICVAISALRYRFGVDKDKRKGYFRWIGHGVAETARSGRDKVISAGKWCQTKAKRASTSLHKINDIFPEYRTEAPIHDSSHPQSRDYTDAEKALMKNQFMRAGFVLIEHAFAFSNGRLTDEELLKFTPNVEQYKLMANGYRTKFVENAANSGEIPGHGIKLCSQIMNDIGIKLQINGKTITLPIIPEVSAVNLLQLDNVEFNGISESQTELLIEAGKYSISQQILVTDYIKAKERLDACAIYLNRSSASVPAPVPVVSTLSSSSSS